MIQIIITINDMGQMNVQGPVEQVMNMLGILEMAKVLVLKHSEQSQKLIQPAAAIPFPKKD